MDTPEQFIYKSNVPEFYYFEWNVINHNGYYKVLFITKLYDIETWKNLFENIITISNLANEFM